METFAELGNGAFVVVGGKVEEGGDLDMGIKGARVELGNVAAGGGRLAEFDLNRRPQVVDRVHT